MTTTTTTRTIPRNIPRNAEEAERWDRERATEDQVEPWLALGWSEGAARVQISVGARLRPFSETARSRQEGRPSATTPSPIATPKSKRQRADARCNDRKIRTVLFDWRNKRNRVNRGLRRLADDAHVSEASIRRALRLWETDGQLTRVRYARGKTQSIILHLEHPAWSEVETSHPPAA
jgi:hypothetical protein